LRIVVLGAGVVGVTAAWYLASDGHEVTVVERQSGPALETSLANGGQISAAHAEPWANPGTPLKILKWLGRADAPMRFRPTGQWRQWRWGLQFLRECLPERTRANTIQCRNLARYSQECLRSLRAGTGLEYDQQERGILQFYTDAKEFDLAAATTERLRDHGGELAVKSVDECVAIESALAQCRTRIAGGVFAPSDESGDAHVFTRELARLCAARGVAFRWGVAVESLAVDGITVRGVRCRTGAEREARRREVIEGDAYVMALGSYSPLMLAPIGVSSKIYPVKGYSVTIAIGGHRGAPTVSLTDVERKLVLSRLGTHLRVAGTAEVSGYGGEIDRARCDALVERTFDLFPDAGERASATFWTGLRPATPSNVPEVGATRYRNLFVDTGHGTLGWTLACGSGRALADLIAGRKPAVDFAFAKAG
jgi:D-amino-acid dehydrogenase